MIAIRELARLALIAMFVGTIIFADEILVRPQDDFDEDPNYER